MRAHDVVQKGAEANMIKAMQASSRRHPVAGIKSQVHPNRQAATQDGPGTLPRVSAQAEVLPALKHTETQTEYRQYRAAFNKAVHACRRLLHTHKRQT